MLPTIAREADTVVMIDQRKLPVEEIYVRCSTAAEVARAIKTMVIRGAPAIGVAAAYGIALGMRKSTATGTQKFAAEFYKTCELMAGTRPTAVNLFLGDRTDETIVLPKQRTPANRSIRSRTGSIAKLTPSTMKMLPAAAPWERSVPPWSGRSADSHALQCGCAATAGYGTALGVGARRR